MKLATAEDMRRIDASAVKDHGLTVASLMERAGEAVVRVLEKEWASTQRRSVLVLCGKGNNGGDGLVVARLLKKKKVKVGVFLTAKPGDLSGEAALQFRKAQAAKVPLRVVEGPEGKKALATALQKADVILDALLGTGLSRKVEGTPREMILAAKVSGKPVLAVDVPSGMSADTGAILGEALPARVTVTFGLPKIGFYSRSGAALCGKVVVDPIGFPAGLLRSGSLSHEMTEATEVAACLPHYDDFIHKGTRGRLLVVAGATGLTGAAALCAMAAQRIGAGLVTVACPQSVNTILEMKLTEPMTAPVPEIEGGFLSPEAAGRIHHLAKNVDAVVLGPGIGRHKETGRLVKDLASSLSVPMVLDADALNLLGGPGEVLPRAPWVVTPHPGEAAWMLKTSVPEVEADRAKVAGQIARGYNATAVLKGRFTLIAGPKGPTRWNPTGNRALATGGTGDVLSGVIGGLLAQGLPPFEAAWSGAYLHGWAGEAASQGTGPDGMLAGDLLPFLPRALREVRESLREPR